MNWAIQFYGILSKEVLRFMRVPYQTIGNPAINALLYLLIFGVSLGEHIQIPDGASYLQFLIPGLLALSVLRNAFENSSSAIIIAKFVDELQDLRIAPLSRAQIALAKATASLTRGIIVALITYIIGFCFVFYQEHTFLTIRHPFLFLYFLVFGGLGIASLGIYLGMLSRSLEFINAISSFVLLPLIYLGGVFYSIDRLPAFWSAASRFNPIYYFIGGMRYAMIGEASVDIPLSAAIIFGFFAVFFVLSLKALGNGANYKRH